MSDTKFIEVNGNKIAYRYFAGEGITVINVGGHRGEMDKSNKAKLLKDYCEQRGNKFICFDYSGYGLSEGETDRWLIDDWAKELLVIIDEVTEGEVVLAGTSMGGYLMLLAALARPQKVKALLGIAAGFGSFLEKYEVEEKEISLEDINLLIKKSYTSIEHNCLVSKINLNIPITFVHGKNDDKVHYSASEKARELISSPDFKVRYIEGADHFLNRDEDKKIIIEELEELLKKV